MIHTSILPGASSRVVQDSEKSLTISVARKHHKKAVQCNGKQCVVAKAFDDSVVGDFYTGAEIGLSVTKLTFPKPGGGEKVIRYATPRDLVPAIREFDRTGVWNIPDGDYTFKPLTPSMRLGARPSRWIGHRTNTDGSGRDGKFRATPTRRISRVRT